MSDTVALVNGILTYHKECEVCDKPFDTRYQWQKYCGRPCRDYAHLRNKRKVSEEEWEEFVKWKASQA